MTERYVAKGSFPLRRPSPTGRNESQPNLQNIPIHTEEGDKIRAAFLSKDNIVHLHWLWKQGPAALRNVASAVAICGQISLPRSNITSFPDDVTCPNCKKHLP